MRKRKRLILVLAGLIIAVFSFSFLRQKKEPIIQPKGELKLVSTLPSPGKNKTLHSSTGIQFSFDASLIASSVSLVINPQTQLVTELSKTDSKTLIVRPKTSWEFDTKYTIVIKKGLNSINN